MDFTLKLYKILLKNFQSYQYKYIRLCDMVPYTGYNIFRKYVILRHDVDLLPHNALAMAQLEHDLGIRGTYYFRIVPESFDFGVIEKIAELGHEIGYHYEDVDLVVKRQKANVKRQVSEVIGDRLKVIGDRSQVMGDRWQVEVGSDMDSGESEKRGIGEKGNDMVPGSRFQVSSRESQHNPGTRNMKHETWNLENDLLDRAMESFLTNLEKMRKIVDVKTICMHGSPISKYDNRLLWTKYNYRDYGIVGEPYFDVDFSEVAYYTDTGRRWDGDAVSVRDKVVVGERCEVIGDRTQVSGDRLKVSSNVSALNTYNLTPLNSNVSTPNTSHLSPHTYFPKFRSTKAMVKAIEEGRFPNTAMLTIHPHRWHDRTYPWLRELFWQNVKNVGKYMLVKIRR